MPTVDEMAQTAVAFALASVTSVKIVSTNPIATDPADLDTPTLSDLGVKDADGVRLFMTMLVSFVPDGAKECIGSIHPVPDSKVGEIEQLVEDCIAAIPADGHMAFAQAIRPKAIGANASIARKATRSAAHEKTGKGRQA